MTEQEYDKQLKAMRDVVSGKRCWRFGDVDCIYNVAIALRSNADGSAEGTASATELVLYADYLVIRNQQWVECSRDPPSDNAIRALIGFVLVETAEFVTNLKEHTEPST